MTRHRFVESLSKILRRKMFGLKGIIIVLKSLSRVVLHLLVIVNPIQGGITCGAIDEPRKSSKAIDERIIINFRDKNVVIARFRDKNVYR